MPTTKEADNVPLRRSSRIAATDSPVLNLRVLTRRASSTEPLERSASPIVTGRPTRAKRLSLSEERQDEDAGEGTPKRITRGTTPTRKGSATPTRRSKRLNSTSPVKSDTDDDKPPKGKGRLLSVPEEMEVIKESEEENKNGGASEEKAKGKEDNLQKTKILSLKKRLVADDDDVLVESDMEETSESDKAVQEGENSNGREPLEVDKTEPSKEKVKTAEDDELACSQDLFSDTDASSQKTEAERILEKFNRTPESATVKIRNVKVVLSKTPDKEEAKNKSGVKEEILSQKENHSSKIEVKEEILSQKENGSSKIELKNEILSQKENGSSKIELKEDILSQKETSSKTDIKEDILSQKENASSKSITISGDESFSLQLSMSTLNTTQNKQSDSFTSDSSEKENQDLNVSKAAAKMGETPTKASNDYFEPMDVDESIIEPADKETGEEQVSETIKDTDDPSVKEHQSGSIKDTDCQSANDHQSETIKDTDTASVDDSQIVDSLEVSELIIGEKKQEGGDEESVHVEKDLEVHVDKKTDEDRKVSEDKKEEEVVQSVEEIFVVISDNENVEETAEVEQKETSNVNEAKLDEDESLKKQTEDDLELTKRASVDVETKEKEESPKRASVHTPMKRESIILTSEEKSAKEDLVDESTKMQLKRKERRSSIIVNGETDEEIFEDTVEIEQSRYETTGINVSVSLRNGRLSIKPANAEADEKGVSDEDAGEESSVEKRRSSLRSSKETSFEDKKHSYAQSDDKVAETLKEKRPSSLTSFKESAVEEKNLSDAEVEETLKEKRRSSLRSSKERSLEHNTRSDADSFDDVAETPKENRRYSLRSPKKTSVEEKTHSIAESHDDIEEASRERRRSSFRSTKGRSFEENEAEEKEHLSAESSDDDAKKTAREKRRSSLKSTRARSIKEDQVEEKECLDVELAEEPSEEDPVKKTPKSATKDRKRASFNKFNEETREQLISSTPATQRVKKPESPSKLEHIKKTSSKKQSVETQIESLIIKNDLEFSDSDQEETMNDFFLVEAEEGEEDTPSEGSNDIIDEGESLHSSSENESNDEKYENDSFVTDDEFQEDLLTGEEFDIYDTADIKSPKKKQTSRIIRPTESSDDENVLLKKQKSPPKLKRSRIIRPSESSADEIDVLAEKSVETVNKSFTTAGIQAQLEEEIQQTDGELKKSVAILQGVKVEDIGKQELFTQISEAVEKFFDQVKDNTGDIKINLSLDYSRTSCTDVDGSVNVSDVKRKKKKKKKKKRKHQNVEMAEEQEQVSLKEDTSLSLDYSKTSCTDLDGSVNISEVRRKKKKNKKKSAASATPDVETAQGKVTKQDVSIKKKKKRKHQNAEMVEEQEQVSLEGGTNLSLDYSKTSCTDFDGSVNVSEVKRMKKKNKNKQVAASEVPDVETAQGEVTEQEEIASIKKKKKKKRKHHNSGMAEDKQQVSLDYSRTSCTDLEESLNVTDGRKNKKKNKKKQAAADVVVTPQKTIIGEVAEQEDIALGKVTTKKNKKKEKNIEQPELAVEDKNSADSTFVITKSKKKKHKKSGDRQSIVEVSTELNSPKVKRDFLNEPVKRKLEPETEQVVPTKKSKGKTSILNEETKKIEPTKKSKLLPSRQPNVVGDIQVAPFNDKLRSKLVEQEEIRKNLKRKSLLPTPVAEDQSWVIESLEASKPSKNCLAVSESKKKKKKRKSKRDIPSASEVVQSRDFKRQRLYDPDHVKRVDTKVLLREKLSKMM